MRANFANEKALCKKDLIKKSVLACETGYKPSAIFMIHYTMLLMYQISQYKVGSLVLIQFPWQHISLLETCQLAVSSLNTRVAIV